MKAEAKLWAGVAVYFVVIGALYAAVGGSPAGVVVLVASAAFGGLVGGWSWRWSRRHHDRAADLADADAGAGLDPIGTFAASSLRPLGIGVGMVMVTAGIPIGLWLVVTGTALLTSQLALLVRDRDG